VAYFQADFVEEMTGLNLHKIIHGEPDRGISSIDEPKPKAKRNRPAGIGGGGALTLAGVDFDSEVFINGTKQPYVSGTSMKVPLNEQITVIVRKPGHKSFMKTLTLTEQESSSLVQVPEAVRARTGVLSSSLNYGSGSVLEYSVDGEKIEKTMPFTELVIPAGTYEAKIRNPVLGTEKKVNFTIEENKIQLLE
jgi:hypothetical protein